MVNERFLLFPGIACNQLNQYPLFLFIIKGLQLIEQLFYNSGGCFQKLVSSFFILERASSISSTTLSETCFSLFLSSIYS